MRCGDGRVNRLSESHERDHAVSLMISTLHRDSTRHMDCELVAVSIDTEGRNALCDVAYLNPLRASQIASLGRGR